MENYDLEYNQFNKNTSSNPQINININTNSINKDYYKDDYKGKIINFIMLFR